MVRTLAVDLNCDLGEGFGRYDLGDDAEMMKWITSANVACGFHAGDPDVMARTVSLAKAHGVDLGAHPGYLDLQGFGRRAMTLSPQAIAHALYYQLGALDAFARISGTRLVHVKPHGALYNLAARDAVTASAIARAVATYDPNLILVGLGGSALVGAGISAGLRVAHEGFPDRAYLPDGQLMPRDQEGALITDPEQVASNAVRLVRDSFRGGDQAFRVDTLCLHGDHHQAVTNARLVRRALEDAGVEIRPMAWILSA